MIKQDQIDLIQSHWKSVAHTQFRLVIAGFAPVNQAIQTRRTSRLSSPDELLLRSIASDTFSLFYHFLKTYETSASLLQNLEQEKTVNHKLESEFNKAKLCDNFTVPLNFTGTEQLIKSAENLSLEAATAIQYVALRAVHINFLALEASGLATLAAYNEVSHTDNFSLAITSSKDFINSLISAGLPFASVYNVFINYLKTLKSFKLAADGATPEMHKPAEGLHNIANCVSQIKTNLKTYFEIS